MLKQLFLILSISIVAGCSSDNRILELGKGDDVIVNLEVLDKTGITKVEFQANGNIEVMNSDDLENYKIVSFGFENKGEGTFKVIVYSKKE